MAGEPYPKSRQLARGERRYRRKVASPKQWQTIIAAKQGDCRCAGPLGCLHPIEYHHLVPRSQGGGDVADNIVPICELHHQMVTRHFGQAARRLLESLTDAEYAYMTQHGGEGYAERVYGLRYDR